MTAPVVKGWLNVYDADASFGSPYYVEGMYLTREEADKYANADRTACIYIERWLPKRG